MASYLSVTEYAKLHCMEVSWVRRCIYSGKIEAIKIGHQWAIPADTPKPEDGRIKSGKYVDWRKKKE